MTLLFLHDGFMQDFVTHFLSRSACCSLSSWRSLRIVKVKITVLLLSTILFHLANWYVQVAHGFLDFQDYHSHLDLPTTEHVKNICYVSKTGFIN